MNSFKINSVSLNRYIKLISSATLEHFCNAVVITCKLSTDVIHCIPNKIIYIIVKYLLDRASL